MLPICGFAQNFSQFAGARSAGLAHSSVAISDVWAAHHNQAALGFLDESGIGGSVENRFFINELKVVQIAGAYHFDKIGTFGLVASSFGFELYNESKYGLSYSRAFGDYFSVGLQLNYQNYYVEEGTGNNGALTFETGILAKPTDKLNIGFHVFNPSQAFKNSDAEERLPYIGRLGFKYQFSDEFFLTAEAKKQQELAERYSLGVEYQFIEVLVFRTGVGIQPLSNHFGLGLKLEKFEVDLSYEYAQTLGSNGVLSLQYYL